MYLRESPSALSGSGGSGAGFGEPVVAPVRALPRVTGFAFVNAGATHADNRCANCPINLGVGVDLGAGRTASNAMELQFTLAGHRAGLEYDITRTRSNSVWERVAGAWNRLQTVPMGTNDDHTDDDESLTPRGNRIFAIDNPGFPDVVLPAAHGLRLLLLNGAVTNVNATDIVQRLTFAEWVIVRDRAAGIPWTPLEFPPLPDGSPRRFVFWHSILWLTRDGANRWMLNAARSEIARGALAAAVINAAPV